jgi:hypothetical protein
VIVRRAWEEKQNLNCSREYPRAASPFTIDVKKYKSLPSQDVTLVPLDRF